MNEFFLKRVVLVSCLALALPLFADEAVPEGMRLVHDPSDVTYLVADNQGVSKACILEEAKTITIDLKGASASFLNLSDQFVASKRIGPVPDNEDDRQQLHRIMKPGTFGEKFSGCHISLIAASGEPLSVQGGNIQLLQQKLSIANLIFRANVKEVGGEQVIPGHFETRYRTYSCKTARGTCPRAETIQVWVAAQNSGAPVEAVMLPSKQVVSQQFAPVLIGNGEPPLILQLSNISAESVKIIVQP